MPTTLFTFRAKDENLATLLESNRRKASDLNKELKGSKEGTAEFSRLSQELNETRNRTTQLAAEQRKLNKEFNAKNLPVDSLVRMRIEYGKLTEAIARMGAEERKSELGKRTIANAQKLSAEIKKVEESTGRFFSSVGNYRRGLNTIGDIAAGVFLGGGLIGAIQGVTREINEGIQGVGEYSRSLAELQAITGVTDKELADLEARANSLTTIMTDGGGEIVNTASEIFEAMELVGSAAPDLLKNAPALEEVTRSAIVLSKASGDDLVTSIKAVTTIMGQFDEQADQSNRIINALAAGSKLGSEEVPGLTDAIQKFGTTADIANVSVEESVALVETLSARQLKGAEAGTQLRNVLAKLAAADVLPKKAQAAFQKLGIDINVLKDTTIPLEDRLRELGKAQGDTAALTQIFGLENLNAATIITSNLDVYKDLVENVQGTQTAFEQAATNADNLGDKFEAFSKKAKNELIATLRDLEPELETMLDLMGTGVELTADFLGVLIKIPGFLSDNKEEMIALAVAIAAYNKESILLAASTLRSTAAFNLLTSAEARSTLATNVLSAAQKAIPILAIVGGIYALVKAFEAYSEGLTATARAAHHVAEAQDEIAENTKEDIGLIRDSIAALTDLNTATDKREAAIRTLTQLYPEYLKGIDLERQNKFQLAAIERDLVELTIRKAAETAKANATAEISQRIIKKELELAELRRAQQAGEWTWQDREFIIGNEERGLVNLRKELEETRKKFDETFKLNEEFQGSALTIVMPEKEKEQVDLRKLTIAQLKELNNQAAQDEIARREKLAADNKTRSAKRVKEEQELVLGSIGFLRAQIEKLRKELEATPESGVEKVIQELAEKEAELDKLEAKIKQLRAEADKVIKLKIEIAGPRAAAAPQISPGPSSTVSSSPDAGPDLASLEVKSVEQAELEKQRLIKETHKTKAELEKEALQKARDNADRGIKTQQDEAAKAIEVEAEKWDNIKELTLSALSSIADAIFAINAESINREEQARLKALDNEYKVRIQKAKGNDKLVAQLEKQAEKRREAIEKEAAEKRKRAAIIESIIATALAVVKALPNYFLAAAVAIAGAAQTAIIASKQFAEGGFTNDKMTNARAMIKRFAVGGFTGPGSGAPDSTGKKVAGHIVKDWGVATYHANEFIASEPMVKKYRPLFERIDQEQRALHGRPFAQGGFTSLPLTSATATAREQVMVETEIPPAVMLRMGEIIAAEVSRMTASEVRTAMAQGLNDSSRRLEREGALQEQRTV